jgi:hypothetical protein
MSEVREVAAPCGCVRQEQLDRLELKLDELLAFRDLVTVTVAPWMSGKGSGWLALLAKTRKGGG